LERTVTLPWWKASPPLKNTEYGIGALWNSLLRWWRSFQVTWKVPGAVGALALPVATGTGP
jgi:hypothetical protein